MSQRSFPRLGFVGGGRMATAMIQGLLRAGVTTAERIVASDTVADIRETLAEISGIEVFADNKAVCQPSDVIVLAVKPQVMAAVLADVKPAVQGKHLVISIAAGITLQQLTEGLGAKTRIVRVMPNAPSLVGAGAAAYCLGAKATIEDADVVRQLLHVGGKAFELPEHLLDAVTGLSGSGPAFVAVIIEALSDAGVRVGLPREVANHLAAQTVYGSAKMLMETGLHAGMLKDMVTSPGGTSAAGLHALEKGGLRAALLDAVVAATQRSQELGR
ncbi:MAG TPA: pyrroline-5-carboxylate reductase [Gemmatales bacterium]|nr:pyrroline-5-carboxylate reductase [Gemmatales bacterium]HMP58600.1 pyrroline-5-carboxylate reductase [Gemmatales bacterium]